MKEIKIKPAYMSIVQQPLCCGPAGFQWVLLRRGLPIFTQEEIAKYCKLKILKKQQKYFLRKFPIVKRAKDTGTTVKDFAKCLQKFIKDKKLPLKITYYLVSQVKDPVKLVVNNLKKGNDIIIHYHSKGLGQRKQVLGHVCVISAIKLGKKSILTLGDPYYFDPKFWDVELDKILKCMKPKWDGYERGFLIVNKK